MKRFFALLLVFCISVCTALPAFAVGYDSSAHYTLQAQSAYIVNTDRSEEHTSELQSPQ